MEIKSINLNENLSQFSEHWAPKIIAQMNDYHFKVVKFQGEFVWHCHDDTDEVFIVLNGEMSIAFRDGTVELNAGRMFVVPKGAEHRPFAQKECKAISTFFVAALLTGTMLHFLSVTIIRLVILFMFISALILSIT
jgi:mannose-6-phosphate isomerase-like protein (cupin superfamily)